MCTCGRTDPHVIARRRTADDYTVCAWSDGPVTAVLGLGIRGVPIVRPRTPGATETAIRAGALTLGEVELWTWDELPALYAACRKVAAKGGDPGDVRAELARHVHPSLRWVVSVTDRDGRPRERYAYLPRIRWPGYVLFDFCGGPGSARGRYVLMTRRMGADTAFDTGLAFGTLEAFWRHMTDAPPGMPTYATVTPPGPRTN